MSKGGVLSTTCAKLHTEGILTDHNFTICSVEKKQFSGLLSGVSYDPVFSGMSAMEDALGDVLYAE